MAWCCFFYYESLFLPLIISVFVCTLRATPIEHGAGASCNYIHTPEGRPSEDTTREENGYFADNLSKERALCGCDGFRRITAMLQFECRRVNHKHVYKIWYQERLKVPSKQSKRGRLRLKDGSCLRLHPDYPDHTWSCYFMLEKSTMIAHSKYSIWSTKIPGNACLSGQNETLPMKISSHVWQSYSVTAEYFCLSPFR